MHKAVHAANRKLSAPGAKFKPDELLGKIAPSANLLEAAVALELDKEAGSNAADVATLLDNLPDGLDAAILAATRDALGRKLRVQLVWQAAAGYEVRMWEASAAELGEDGAREGVLTVHLLTPDPFESGP
jgi:hypothetical protein